jgi:integrase
MGAIQTRKTGDGEVRHKAVIRLKGHPTQTATFRRRTDAKDWIQQTEAAIREGRYFKTAEAKRHTVKDLVERYERDVLPGKRSGDSQKHHFAWWRENYGAYLLSDLTPAMVAEARDRLAGESTHQSERRSHGTVNRYLAALSHACTVAVQEWAWLDANPLRKVRKLKEPRGRVRYLDEPELARLVAEARASDSAHLYPVVVLAVSTGMRQGEILGLRWADLDVDGGRIVLHETKNGERRVVPLVGHAREVLREHGKLRRIGTDLVFPGGRRKDGEIRRADIRNAWTAAVTRAGLDDFRFHDLRHTAASYLAMNGATLSEIAAVLGHKTLAMVKRYAHLSEAHTTQVVTAMNARMFGASTGKRDA